MKRKRLLFAAIALIAGALNINAQGWVPSEIADGDYYLYNVGADAYLYHGSNWNTHGVVRKNEGFIVNVSKVSESIITISTNSFYSGKYFTDNGYVDTGSPTNWTVEEVDAENHIFKLSSNGNYAFVINNQLGDIGIGEDTGDDYSKWQFVTRNARIAAFETATEENPVDASFLLTNPNFTEGTKGWTCSPGSAGLGGTRGEDAVGNGSGNYKRNQCCEVFNQNFNFYQKVNGAPAGKYRLSFQGFYRYGGHGIDPAANARNAGTEQLNTTLYANNESAPLMSILDEKYETEPGAGGWSFATIGDESYYVPNNMEAAAIAFNDDKYVATMDFSVTTGDLTIGVKKETAVTNDWTIFDTAILTYLGPLEDLSEFETELAMQVNAASNITPLPTNAKLALDEIVSTYNQTYTTMDDYLTAISAVKAANDAASALSAVYVEALDTYPIPVAATQALAAAVTNADEGDYSVIELFDANTAWLTSAVAEAKAWIEPYAAYNDAMDAIQALYDVAEYEELVEGAHADLGAALEAGGAGDVAETIDLLNLATENLKNAGYIYAASANPTGDAKFDLTFLLTNPDLTNLPSWEAADGWYTDQTFETQNNQVMDTDGQHYYEYWSDSSNPVSGYTVYLKTTLPEGAYEMTAKAKAGWGWHASNEGGKQNITFSAGDIDGTSITSSGALEDAAIEFINGEEQEVKIGLKAHEGNTCNWMGIGYVRLYKIAPKPFVISENETYDNTQSGAGDVELTRTIKVGMNSVVLPFQLTLDDIATLGGEGAVAYEATGFEGTSLKLAKVTESVLANTPFFLDATAAGTEFEFEGKTIVAGEPVVTAGDAQLVGTYEAITVPEDSYILSGGKFYLVDSEVSLKPTRAYVVVAAGEAKVLTIDIEDATAIEAIESEIANAQVYDLSGRKVQSPVRGLYIANGKKVLVK